MSKTKTVHVISHTHWDREWFLTHAYTDELIVTLIDAIYALAQKNPKFCYQLDGQTIIIEDLLKLHPEYKNKVAELIKNKNLVIGPYYCQIDWRLPTGELLVRNLSIAKEDMDRYNTKSSSGWAIDIFGHISQEPQLHKMFGISTIYVWRGIPEFLTEFMWKGSDKSKILAVHLVGSYRNLYGALLFPYMAEERLEREVQKLAPYYDEHMPLYEGYNLEFEPTDAAGFYVQKDFGKKGLKVMQSTPDKYARTVARKELKVIEDELLSGKFSSTYPGTLSARTYIKMLHSDCEKLVFRYYEPLLALSGVDHENAKELVKDLLKNAVHDPICGACIDQVHERTEDSYKEIYAVCRKGALESLSSVMGNFKEGVYCYSPWSSPVSRWFKAKGMLHKIASNGIGIYKILDSKRITRVKKEITSFTWTNDFYEVALDKQKLSVNGFEIGLFSLFKDKGDPYNQNFIEEKQFKIKKWRLAEKKDEYVMFQGSFSGKFFDVKVDLDVCVSFFDSQVVECSVDVDTKGVDFALLMHFVSQNKGDVYTQMPFDVVKRERKDTDLFDRELSDEYAHIVLSQREVHENVFFPFHERVSLYDGDECFSVFAKGVRSYMAFEGTISLVLRRGHEWKSRSNLTSRVGDAASKLYIPGGRCERKVTHKLGFSITKDKPDSVELCQLTDVFAHDPLVFSASGKGKLEEFSLCSLEAPVSACYMHKNKVYVRAYNPGLDAFSLPSAYKAVDSVSYKGLDKKSLDRKEIVLLRIVGKKALSIKKAEVTFESFMKWRVGKDGYLPSKKNIDLLGRWIESYQNKANHFEGLLEESKGNDYHIMRRKYYIFHRKVIETTLSRELNLMKLHGEKDYIEVVHPKIRKLAYDLIKARAIRRAYDHIVSGLDN